jgi:hypothetical protein
MPNFNMTRTTLLYCLITTLLFACGNSEKNIDDKKKLDLKPTNKVSQIDQKEPTKIKDIINWEFLKVKNDELIFKGGNSYKTDLFDLEYIGQIKADPKAPYLIFSGRDCEGCDENINIYIHSPSDGKLRVENGQNRYQFPGMETDYETDSLLYTSQAYFGEILEKKYGLIWYENNLLENGKMGKSTFVTYIENGILRDTIFVDHKDLSETLKLLKRGLCKEIKGRKYSSEP